MTSEISLDQFFDRRLSLNYTCFDHAAEVWEHITGEALKHRVTSYVKYGKLSLNDARDFVELAVPTSPCLVLMDHAITSEPHLGVYFEGRVMQLAAHGVEFQPLSVVTVGFKKVRFYK